ncbi:hypothetical protein R1sor_024879 [Riccia sorocarpa]|uniref:Uncharacterized protein n=1 Tax=Riccia sorocarpa TaxID=122646 RepID=A0ABD3GSI7_9MARC
MVTRLMPKLWDPPPDMMLTISYVTKRPVLTSRTRLLRTLARHTQLWRYGVQPLGELAGAVIHNVHEQERMQQEFSFEALNDGAAADSLRLHSTQWDPGIREAIVSTLRIILLSWWILSSPFLPFISLVVKKEGAPKRDFDKGA